MRKPKKQSGKGQVVSGKRAAAGAEPAAAKQQTPQFPVVGLGASAGGLEAFKDFLKALPEDTGMAFVLVQHLDPKHGSVLPEILSRATNLPVMEARQGVKVQPDHVYVMPANTDMAIKDGALRLDTRHLTDGRHLPIDHFFQSLAEGRGERAIGVILSGTASDGTAGCKAIKAAGGITFAQDEGSAKYGSMPRSAIAAGWVDFILSPESIARELARISRHPYLVHYAPLAAEPRPMARGDELAPLYAMLLDATGVDFTHYKQSTLQRRIDRRMALNRVVTIRDYIRYVRGKPGELEELYKDILIHTTGFFRDPGMYEVLENTILPQLLATHGENGPARIWVAGCSTGEEAYSIVMTVLEYIWDKGSALPRAAAGTKSFQVFATDISDASLQKARSGVYSQAEVSGVSKGRLKRFFTRGDGGYQINKPVREVCLFARHNITKDPPFLNLDLISCRNLLIYLGPDLQRRVVPALHYALKNNGYLILGESESPGAFAENFRLVDRKHKVYQKKRTQARLSPYFGSDVPAPRKLGDFTPEGDREGVPALEKEVDRILTSRFMPPSVLVNEDLEILEIRGKTGKYLELPSGSPTLSLAKMAREGLYLALRMALAKAKKQNAPVLEKSVRVQSDGEAREVDLEIIPIQNAAPNERNYLIVFQEGPRPAPALPPAERIGKAKRAASALARENARLRGERREMQEQLRTLIEEHESTTEEFKSANEEVMSANEELQSTNEELETAKEELQSSNEELTTLNDELNSRNTELSVANNDLANVLSGVDIPIVIVSNDLRIRRFTPAAEKLLNLIAGDVGRRLSEIRPNVEIHDLASLAGAAIDTGAVQQRELKEKNGKWYVALSRPYKTWDHKIEGAVISFQDIDILKRNLDQARVYAAALIEYAPEPTLILDRALRVQVANKAYYQTFQVLPKEVEKRDFYRIGNGRWNIPRLREWLAEVLSTNARMDDFRVRRQFPNLGRRNMALNARRIEPEPGRQLVQVAIKDVTEREALESIKNQAALMDLVGGAVIVRDQAGTVQFWNKGAENLYGWPKEEAIGKDIGKLLRTECPQTVEEIQAEVIRSGRWEGGLVQHARDGSRLEVISRWAAQLQVEDAPLRFVEVNTDVTTLKRSESGLRTLSGYLLRAQDNEQRRIARELHDSVGQKLVALKMALNAASRTAVRPAVHSSLAESLKFTGQIMKEVSSMAYLLHPPMLEDAGLVSAIRWLVEGMAKRSGLEAEFSLPRKYKRLPGPVELALFRIAQECFTNVVRHAHATKVSVRLEQTRKATKLEIADDGKGITEKRTRKQEAGVGITGMKERIAQVGGTLEVRSSGKGTVVTAFLPKSGRGRRF